MKFGKIVDDALSTRGTRVPVTRVGDLDVASDLAWPQLLTILGVK